jgi:UDP-N-acetylglucosamine/UDP-N-acetylgalactosamine diphosphorylase
MIPDDLRQRLRAYDQEHVLAWWPNLDENQRQTLLAQLQEIDPPLIRQLYQQRDTLKSVPPLDAIRPIVPDQLADTDQATRHRGEEALRRGEVAALVVAGGQGTRLGRSEPKGMYPIGPVSGHSLFQIHAEKVLALRRRYGQAVPLLIMTSPVTDERTREFFTQNHNFGLPPEDVFFFCQGTIPAVDMASGRLLLDNRGSLALSPNGHGGMLPALRASGRLQQLQQRGVRHLFYLQVDNPLTRVADPLFLGHHLARHAEVSTKVIPKLNPEDRLGNVVLVDGRCSIIEYSDLPQDLAQQRDAQGQLVFQIGSPAIHIFDLDFLARLSQDKTPLPFHIARKKVPFVDEAGSRVEPKKENGLKFEMFIFDVLPRADRWTVVATRREEEFAPLKNAANEDSPATAQAAMIRQARHWLEQAGVRVEGPADGEPIVEISPLLALGPEELRGKWHGELKVKEPVYLSKW